MGITCRGALCAHFSSTNWHSAQELHLRATSSHMPGQKNYHSMLPSALSLPKCPPMGVVWAISHTFSWNAQGTSSCRMCSPPSDCFTQYDSPSQISKCGSHTCSSGLTTCPSTLATSSSHRLVNSSSSPCTILKCELVGPTLKLMNSSSSEELGSSSSVIQPST